MKYALRTLWKDRGFAAPAVFSLAIGIGANTAIFSLVNGVLLRPLDFPQPQRLVAISISTLQFGLGKPLPINLAQLVEWRKRTQSFMGVGAWRSTTVSFTGSDVPELISGARVSANLFDILGVQPRLGRSFVDQEDHRGRHQVVILADSIWHRRFNADPSVVGRNITLNGEPHTVVGVLPPGFEFPRQPAANTQRTSGTLEMFLPLAYRPQDLVPRDGDLNCQGLARLRPGVSARRALADLTSAEAAIDAQIGPGSWQITPVVTPLQRQLTGDVQQSLVVLMAAVGAVLLVLCVNLANLSLSRAAGHARESAIRTALGASRWDLARQSFTETTLLASVGGGLGILFAFLGLQELLAAAPVDLPRLGEVSVDARVLVFALALSALTAVLFGILPALRTASSGAPYETLKSTRYSNAGGPAGLHLRNLLVALEVGLCAALLVTAGLFLSSFVRLTTIPRGFDIERVLAVDVALPAARYTKDVDVARFFETVLAQARSLPGVESAAVSSFLPLKGETWIDVVGPLNDPRPDSQLPNANLRFISPGYFQTLHIPMRDGRDFELSDRNRLTAVISESLARKLWSNTSAIGRKLIDVGKVHEVVGVVGNARTTSLDKSPVDMLYIPLWQRPQNSSSILVRTAMDTKSIAAALRTAVWSADRDIPVPEERTLEQIMSASLARRRFQMTLVLVFAVAALALAAFGTYGVVAYSVSRRRAEIGIRLALGAGKVRILRLVLSQGMVPVFAGLAAGVLAALAIGRYVSSLLFEVSPHDPVAFTVAALVLITVSALACWIPARRAAGLNPLDAIRYE